MTEPEKFALLSSLFGIACIFLALVVRKVRIDRDRKARVAKDVDSFFAAEARRAK